MKPRVLVVDDDPLYAQAAKAILELDGRTEVIGFADNGDRAVSLALELRPDVVLMDINMPVLDGIETAALLKEMVPSTRVVLVSSFADENRTRAEKAGAFAAIAKALGGPMLVETTLAAAEAVPS
jgi:two-component system, NarL family, response regulator LiaR